MGLPPTTDWIVPPSARWHAPVNFVSNLASVGLADVLPLLERSRSVVMVVMVEMVEMVEMVPSVALVAARMVGLTVVRSSSHDRPGS